MATRDMLIGRYEVDITRHEPDAEVKAATSTALQVDRQPAGRWLASIVDAIERLFLEMDDTVHEQIINAAVFPGTVTAGCVVRDATTARSPETAIAT